MKFYHLRLLPVALLVVTGIYGQKEPARIVNGIPVNYNEDSVGTYTLPDPLMLNNGSAVKNADDWIKKRRPEIVRLYEENQFGKMPARPNGMHFTAFDKGTPVFGGKAIRKQVTVYFTKDTASHKMDLLIYLPANSKKPVPLLFLISFTANVNMINDPGIKDGLVWTKEGKQAPAKSVNYPAKLNIDPFIEQGIGVATVYYGDIEPDFAGGIQYGIRSVYLKPGQTQAAPGEWGAISAWAWGLSRAMDYFETDKQVDAKHIALFGVSRLGKTVLWAGASDTRFAMVIANCSGEGGAALSRRNYGETIKLLSLPARYAYQFCANYQKYADSVNRFPVDGHLLISLMAPRPLLLETGDQDYWSDPKGEFLAAVAATPVYHLFEKTAMETNTFPAAGQPVLNTLGYSMHSGGHGTVPSDWDITLAFIRKYLLK
ncbi:MAG: acetylxylan esterase [Bacteroidota bacterium]|nr:acetylxylan esterase [Bacteroidota bacterium]